MSAKKTEIQVNPVEHMDNKSATTSGTSDNWISRPVPAIRQHLRHDATAAKQLEPSIECPHCHAVTSRTAMDFNLYVCPHCDEHLRLGARDRLKFMLDKIENELGQNLTTPDPLSFNDSKPYSERLSSARAQTGEDEALVVVEGKIDDLSIVAGAFEFGFMGGSMGSVVGDRFVKACETALAKKVPLVCFAASGGARMQEGMLSLIQMARTSAAIQKLHEATIPYIVVLTNPVYGGVSASLATLGDILIAEPKAMVGFAGKRVIEQTVREKLGAEFQTAEYLLEHGAIDQIVHRHGLKETLYRLLTKLLNRPS